MRAVLWAGGEEGAGRGRGPRGGGLACGEGPAAALGAPGGKARRACDGPRWCLLSAPMAQCWAPGVASGRCRGRWRPLATARRRLRPQTPEARAPAAPASPRAGGAVRSAFPRSIQKSLKSTRTAPSSCAASVPAADSQPVPWVPGRGGRSATGRGVAAPGRGERGGRAAQRPRLQHGSGANWHAPQQHALAALAPHTCRIGRPCAPRVSARQAPPAHQQRAGEAHVAAEGAARAQRVADGLEARAQRAAHACDVGRVEHLPVAAAGAAAAGVAAGAWSVHGARLGDARWRASAMVPSRMGVHAASRDVGRMRARAGQGTAARVARMWPAAPPTCPRRRRACPAQVSGWGCPRSAPLPLRPPLRRRRGHGTARRRLRRRASTPPRSACRAAPAVAGAPRLAPPGHHHPAAAAAAPAGRWPRPQCAAPSACQPRCRRAVSTCCGATRPRCRSPVDTPLERVPCHTRMPA